MTDKNLKDFCNLYLLKYLIKKPTCLKNPENPKTIDLILTSRPRSFCNSDTLETGLSDSIKLTVTVLKMFFKKQPPNVISYRNYKNFSNDSFRTNLINEISSNGILERDLTGFLDACKLKKICYAMSQILTIQLKEQFRNTKTILAYK